MRDFVVNVGDRVYFDFDQYQLRSDAQPVLAAQATWLNRYPAVQVRIEGNADERGSDEYNMALGDKRAEATKEFLTGLGVSGAQLDVISYGKQRPVCTDHTEDCWQKNRRAHLVAENGPNQ
jgi:peptidoglycan-associated lipoprotein